MNLVWGMLSVDSSLPTSGLTDDKGPTLQIRSMVLSKTFIPKVEILFQLVEAPVAVL